MRGRSIGVAGVGLIGGSIALDARAAGATVIGFDRDEATLRAALAAGALDAAAPDLATLARRCEMLVVALPVDATVAALGEAALSAPGLVFDVASVKVPVAAAGCRLTNFVASHPLAGRENGGFAAAERGLFAERPWAIVPAENPAAEAALTAFVRGLGGRPVRIGAADHDRLVGLTSHLPQAVSVALAALLAERIAGDPRVVDLCGPGIASMLRLAHSPADLWAPIVAANAAPLASELRALANLLESAASGLEAGKVEPLMAYFAAGRRALDATERSEPSPRSLPDTVSPR